MRHKSEAAACERNLFKPPLMCVHARFGAHDTYYLPQLTVEVPEELHQLFRPLELALAATTGTDANRYA